ncbi:MAG: hypothetical protein OHK0056_29780 [Bacteriovoracaceae bacterium]
MNIKNALNLLDKELKIIDEKREITICGCASLNLQKYTDRATQDVDVISPKIDLTFQKAVSVVAIILNTNLDWLNDNAYSVSEILLPDWEKRLDLIYKGQNLSVFSISRIDLITSKLDAMANRDRDLFDLVSMRPNDQELETASTHLKFLQDTDGYSKWLDRCVFKIKERRDKTDD